eukprot:363640-Chlamydomonas_euryale.AAC.3
MKSSRQLFPLLLYLLLLLILPPPTRDDVLMTVFGSLLCTCAHQLHARKDRHESVRAPWHTLVAEAPGPMCEIHTVRGKCGVAEPATPSAAAAALHLRVQYVLYATGCVFVRTVRRRPQVRTYCATLSATQGCPVAKERARAGGATSGCVRTAHRPTCASAALLCSGSPSTRLCVRAGWAVPPPPPPPLLPQPPPSLPPSPPMPPLTLLPQPTTPPPTLPLPPLLDRCLLPATTAAAAAAAVPEIPLRCAIGDSAEPPPPARRSNDGCELEPAVPQPSDRPVGSMRLNATQTSRLTQRRQQRPGAARGQLRWPRHRQGCACGGGCRAAGATAAAEDVESIGLLLATCWWRPLRRAVTTSG